MPFKGLEFQFFSAGDGSVLRRDVANDPRRGAAATNQWFIERFTPWCDKWSSAQISFIDE